MGASRVACASFNLGTNTTITITRDSSNYTHTLKYSFNGATGTIVTKTTATNYVWTPPASKFYSKIANSTSGYGTITCETYNGTSLVGTTNCGFYAYTVKSVCEPTVSGTVVDTNPATIALTGNANTLVLYLSKPKCTLTATPKNNATIETIQIENPIGLVATTSPYTFDTVYGKEFRFKATDSRGYSKTTKVEVANFIDYEPCYFSITPSVTRVESTSTTATATLAGYCFNGSFGSANNEISLKYRYKTSDGAYGNYVSITPTWNTNGTFTANTTIPNLSLSETYTIEFVVSDKLTSFPMGTILGQSTGDIRIAKDYIQTKNKIVAGEKENLDWKCFTAHRKYQGVYYDMNFGIGFTGGALELRTSTDGGEGNVVARYDIKSDGYMYNTLTGMSVAEIMSSVSSNETIGGYMLLNSGDNVPVLIQWGKITQTPTTANVSSPQQVTFLFEFANTPNVFLTPQSGLGVAVDVAADYVSKSGFNSYLKRGNVAPITISWIAIGNGTNAMPM
jgi:hypothetical protein